MTNYWLCLVGFGFTCIGISFSEEKTKVFSEIVTELQSSIVYDI